MADAKSNNSTPPPPYHRSSIGRYEVAYPLAMGGMASVYVGRLAGFAGFEKLVAIKMIHPHLATEKEFVAMFLDEARLAARVHHPNVAEVYEVGIDEDQLFMICEFINGRSLKHLIQEGRRQGRHISRTVATWICAQVCEGLHAAHELTSLDGSNLNLVHRDVSPNNVLLSYEGFVKLIDFGVAFANDREAKTAVGMVKGKFGYIAPEVLCGEPFDRRADIFSTGVMLYHLATGRHPFDALTDVEKLRKSVEADFILPSKVLKSIDADLESIILQAMHREPGKRFQTAADMGRCLMDYTTKLRKGIGPKVLKGAMSHLFAEKKESHRQKLKEFRESLSGIGDRSRSSVPSKNGTGTETAKWSRDREGKGDHDEESPDNDEFEASGSFTDLPDLKWHQDSDSFEGEDLTAGEESASFSFEDPRWNEKSADKSFSSNPEQFINMGASDPEAQHDPAFLDGRGSVNQRRGRSSKLFVGALLSGLAILAIFLAAVFSDSTRFGISLAEPTAIIEGEDQAMGATTTDQTPSPDTSTTERPSAASDEPTVVEKPAVTNDLNPPAVAPGKEEPPPEPLENKKSHIAVPLRLAPSSAELSVDGELVETKSNILLIPNDNQKHVIAVWAQGYHSQIRSVVATEDLLLKIELIPVKKKKQTRVRRTGKKKPPLRLAPKPTEKKKTAPVPVEKKKPAPAPVEKKKPAPGPVEKKKPAPGPKDKTPSKLMEDPY